MKTRWPDPPPLFAVTDRGERASWVPRGRALSPRRARVRDDGLSPALFDRRLLDDAQEQDMAFDDVVAGYSPAADSYLTRIAVFDLETTGVSTGSDRIVTAYVGVLDDSGSVIDESRWLADPGIEIPAGATAVHGVTTERARAEGREAREVVQEITAALRALLAAGIPVVAYNAAYDLTLLRNEALRHGIEPIEDPAPVIDPLVIDKRVDTYRKGKRTLDIVAAHYGVELTDAHDAAADAIAAGRIALALVARFANDLPGTVTDLHEAQAAWAAEQAEDLTRYFVKIGKFSPGQTIDGSWPIK
jgi:DNA polymerase-3 subunit epsilon